MRFIVRRHLRMETQQSLRENIVDGILSRGSFLYDEVRLCFSRSCANRAVLPQFCKPSRLANANEVKPAGLKGNRLPGYLAATAPDLIAWFRDGNQPQKTAAGYRQKILTYILVSVCSAKPMAANATGHDHTGRPGDTGNRPLLSPDV